MPPVSYAATDRLLVGGSVTFLDSKLTKDFCENLDTTGLPLPPDQCDPLSFAPSGTELPVAPNFKGNVIARYNFPLGSFEAHLHGALGAR